MPDPQLGESVFYWIAGYEGAPFTDLSALQSRLLQWKPSSRCEQDEMRDKTPSLSFMVNEADEDGGTVTQLLFARTVAGVSKHYRPCGLSELESMKLPGNTFLEGLARATGAPALQPSGDSSAIKVTIARVPCRRWLELISWSKPFEDAIAGTGTKWEAKDARNVGLSVALHGVFNGRGIVHEASVTVPTEADWEAGVARVELTLHSPWFGALFGFLRRIC
jgi:hypothetical protein